MTPFSFAMLSAETLGYDTAPMEGFDGAGVKGEFGISDEAEVIALLAIGHVKEPDKNIPADCRRRLRLRKNTAGHGSNAWVGPRHSVRAVRVLQPSARTE